MDGWVNKGESMEGWKDGRVKVYMDKNMEGWKYKWIRTWKGKVYMDKNMEGWKYIWLRTWKGERVDGWEDGWTNEWMVSLQGLSVY